MSIFPAFLGPDKNKFGDKVQSLCEAHQQNIQLKIRCVRYNAWKRRTSNISGQKSVACDTTFYATQEKGCI